LTQAFNLKRIEMNAKKIVVVALTLGMCTAGVAARADNCAALLGDLAAYAAEPQTREQRWIDFKMVMNKADMSWSQYTPGKLTYYPPRQIGDTAFPAKLDGFGDQFFSDRSWDCFSVCGGEATIGDSPNPFNPHKTDRLRVTINLNLWQNTVIFTLMSWGKAQSMSNPECDDSFMYGRVDDAMYVFSFKKQSLAIPH
jgi:hypothetical protein